MLLKFPHCPHHRDQQSTCEKLQNTHLQVAFAAYLPTLDPATVPCLLPTYQYVYNRWISSTPAKRAWFARSCTVTSCSLRFNVKCFLGWLAGCRGLTANMRPSGGREYHYGLQTAAIPAHPDGCRLRWLALSGGEGQASGGSPCRYPPGTSPSQCDRDTCRLERLDHNVAGTDITVERSTRLVENRYTTSAGIFWFGHNLLTAISAYLLERSY